MQGHGHIDNSDAAPERQHGNHGHNGFAAAAQHTRRTVGKCQQSEEQTDNPGMSLSDGNSFLHVHKETEKLRCPYVNNKTNHFRQSYPGYNTKCRALLGSVVFFCPQVLTDKGGQGNGHAGNRQERKALDFTVSAHSGHSIGAEGVNVGLHHHIADTDNRILDAVGKPLHNNLSHEVRIIPDGSPSQSAHILHTAHFYNTQNGADTLGNYGCHTGACHAVAEFCHKKQIQHHIQNRRKHQIIKRVDAVTQSPHDCHADVIHNNSRNAAEINPQIHQGIRHNLFRCLHDPEQPGSQKQSKYGCNHRSNDAEQEIGVHRLIYGIHILSAEIFGNHHTAAGSHATEKTDNQENHAARGADRRKGVVVGKISYNPGIRHIIKLLQKLA